MDIMQITFEASSPHLCIESGTTSAYHVTSLTTFTTQRKFVWFMEKLRLPVIDVGEKRFLQSRPRRQPPVWENTFYDAVV